MQGNPLLALALDGLGNAAVEKVAQQVCARLAEQAQAKGLQASTPLSPGEPDWPVEVGQPQIFALLDPSQAGVTLTSGGMMIPQKSISFVLGVGPEMAQTDACDVCSLKETCRYRHA
jgi:cobalamin-dependent methionine synthase I